MNGPLRKHRAGRLRAKCYAKAIDPTAGSMSSIAAASAVSLATRSVKPPANSCGSNLKPYVSGWRRK